MKKLILLPVFGLVLVLAACGDTKSQSGAAETSSEPAMSQTAGQDAQHTAAAAVQASMQNGVQVVEITAGPNGYEPAQIALEAGVPARLVFTRTTPSPCLAQVMVPEFGIDPVDLPMNEPVAVEFTPTDSGAFTFACGMDMMHGSMVVRS